MNTYIAGSLAGMTACAFIVFTAELPPVPAVDLALAGGWPGAAPDMARHAKEPWLLRAMSRAAAAGTLTTLPRDEPAPPQSL